MLEKFLVINNIAIEKHIEAVNDVTFKTRSVSMVSSLSPPGKVSYHQEGRSKSVTEREILENNNGGRKKSKKCSMFATIDGQCDKEYKTHANVTEIAILDLCRKRTKSSKNVSIAENLNLDYSATDVSEHESENVDIGNTEYEKPAKKSYQAPDFLYFLVVFCITLFFLSFLLSVLFC